MISGGATVNVGDRIIVRKIIPIEESVDLNKLSTLEEIRRTGTIGVPGQRTYVARPYDLEGVTTMENVYDKLTLNYDRIRFSKTETAIELEMSIRNEGVELEKGSEFDPITGDPLGFTKEVHGI